jgi:hypothetical protein
MKKYLVRSLGLLAALSGLLAGTGTPAPGQVGVQQAVLQSPAATPPGPAATPSIILYERHGHVTPTRRGCQHTGAGNIDVAQPTPDTVIVTMTGAALAAAHPCKDSVAAQDFDLNQCFEVVYDTPQPKPLKMTVDARVIGLLRSRPCGTNVAEESGAVTLASGPTALVTITAPAHSVSRGENLSINDHEGPVSVPVVAGKFTLHQVFHVAVSHSHCLLPVKAATAEFAPDPAIDPLWMSYWEPFHGANKKDFGFQVTLKVAPN